MKWPVGALFDHCRRIFGASIYSKVQSRARQSELSVYLSGLTTTLGKIGFLRVPITS